MANIHQDLINKELTSGWKSNLQFKYQKLSNKFLDWLFNHYNVCEATICFYDSEPDTEEYSDEYCDYLFETPEGRSKWRKMVEAYEPIRLVFNNWIDIAGPGIWMQTQYEVDKYAKQGLKELRSRGKMKNRLYYSTKDNYAYIYYYGRDTDWLCDYCWIFRRK